MNMLMKQNKKMDDDNITITTNVMQYNEVKKRLIAIKISDEDYNIKLSQPNSNN